MSAGVVFSDDRAAHWIKLNHQNRIPKRWIAFDTESRATRVDGVEVQQWSMGAAYRWRHGLKTGNRLESATFGSSEDLWRWVTDYCRTGQRTVAYAHNLGYDIRISDALNILPTLGWRLEWCNLDRNVSAITWRGERGTLVFADLWTWLPVPLSSVGLSVERAKLPMPGRGAHIRAWERYCLRDAEIVYLAVSELVDYIASNDLGNWQPTGAGMAYATWRHKYMTHKVLVHDDIDAIAAERAAMHTGRAEAWRHGTLRGDVWTEIDMRNAYVSIASDSELPVKIKFRTGAINAKQYRDLAKLYRVLAHCRISTDCPVVPYHTGERTIWPVGTFKTWLWDTEVDQVLAEGAEVKILDAYTYTRAPILGEWARWILALIDPSNELDSPVVRTWAKHCGRALIGRLSLRTPRWERYGTNPMGDAGIIHMLDAETGESHRMMHVGDRTMIETERTEGRDSLPQVTGWIMAECRRRLWLGMRHAGLGNVAHVDTDSLVVNRAGLERLRDAYGDDFERVWQVKGSWRRLIVYGPRNYRADDTRKVAGVPRKAIEVAPNEFTGEKWTGLATNVERGQAGRVTIEPGYWELKTADPRRLDAPGTGTLTVAVQVPGVVSSGVSSDSRSGSGA